MFAPGPLDLMTGDEMLPTAIPEFRIDIGALGDPQGATTISRHPAGGLMGLGTSPLRVRRGGVPRDRATALPPARPSYRGASARQRSAPPSRLDDLTYIHHRHAVADMTNDTQVMGDEQVGQLELFLELRGTD